MDVAYQESAYQAYATNVSSLTAPLYNVPGNHDNGGAPDYDYAFYDEYVGMDHFAVTIGPVRVIGYKITTLADASAIVEAGEKAYVLGELAALDGLIPVIMAHAACPDEELEAAFVTYGVAAYLHGDGHHNCIAYTLDGITHVDGGSTDTTHTDDQTNTDGGFMVVDVFADRLEIIYARARWGWDRFRQSNSGIANDVQYTPVTIPLPV